MLVSGTLGERCGTVRTIRIAYGVYALAALMSAVAPWFWLFQFGGAACRARRTRSPLPC
jgi:ACDE family multidrug resistance protein